LETWHDNTSVLLLNNQKILEMKYVRFTPLQRLKNIQYIKDE
jgi:hypothetical protein